MHGDAGLLLVLRAAIALLFLVSAWGKITKPAGTIAYMEGFGIPGILRLPAAIFEIVVAVALIVRFAPSATCIAMAGWCVLTGAIFHRAWSDSMQLTHFFKNVSLAGALLAFAIAGLP